MKSTRIYTVIGNKYFVLLTLIFTLIFGLRPDSVGTDTMSYKFFFTESSELSFEPGFNFIIHLFRYFGWSVFKISWAFFFVSLTIYNLVKLKLNYALITILFSTALFTQFGVNTIRASSSLILLLYLLRENKITVKSILWSLLALSIHFSAAVVLALVAIIYTKRKIVIYSCALLGLFLIVKFVNFNGIQNLLFELNILESQELMLLGDYADEVYKTGFRPEFLLLPLFYTLLTSLNLFGKNIVICLALLPIMLFPMMDRVFIFYWLICIITFLRESRLDLSLKILALIPLIPGVILK